MANITGPQPDVIHCPACKGDLVNIPRDQMRSPGYIRADGTVALDTHTYQCAVCNRHFEINQAR